MRTKYVILTYPSGLVAPIVFSELLTHADVARGVGGTVLGAGFCYINEKGRFTCYGNSVSLKIESVPERDSKILNKELIGCLD